jgi:hypothetical protein
MSSTEIQIELYILNTFWLYPWMLSRNGDSLVAATPAFSGFHVVEQFHGQSSAELSVMEITDIDHPFGSASS